MAVARGQLAGLVGADPREIVFTSGATEANNIAIKGAARFAAGQGSDRRRVITVATEHKCVLDSVAELRGEGFDPVDPAGGRRDGMLDPVVLAAALAEPTVLVSVMAANNETGVLQDLPALAAVAHAAGALFHTDAAQALGKVAFSTSAGIDLASFSAHKLYGPKGRRRAVRPPPPARPAPAAVLRRRAGAGAAVRHPAHAAGGGLRRGVPASPPTRWGRRRTGSPRCGTACWPGCGRRLPGLRVNGSLRRRLPGNLNITLPHRRALEVMRAAPDLCVSTGSACSSAEVAPSTVLAAMGLDPAAAGRSLRVGLGRFTSAADVDFAIGALSALPEPAEA